MKFSQWCAFAALLAAGVLLWNLRGILIELFGSVVIAVALSSLVSSLEQRLGLRRWQALGVGLLLGGAIGNGLDRWRLGTVVDFLEFVPFQFPIFNLADAAINLAVAALAIDVLARAGHGDR